VLILREFEYQKKKWFLSYLFLHYAIRGRVLSVSVEVGVREGSFERLL
jgi:hypothetical protein